ncbi:MAG TPA: hypothetical protein VEC60_01280 [Reyranella sp.]|nr:hypothetical protein [Reyranella sp.]
MFSLHPNGGAQAGSRAAEAQSQELHHEPSTGPFDGDLLDLYAAILIVVPLALGLKAFLF